jgi:hypothetical protein
MGAEPSITSSETQQNGNIYVTGKSVFRKNLISSDFPRKKD